jgi:hypothetical protein
MLASEIMSLIVRLEFVVEFSNSVWISRLIVLNIKTSETRVSPTDENRTSSIRDFLGHSQADISVFFG